MDNGRARPRFQSFRCAYRPLQRAISARITGYPVIATGPASPQAITPALSFARDREMTIRWIWLVPSKICITFASRM